MRPHTLHVASLASLVPLASAICPLYGNVFPKPTNLADSPVVKAALQNLTDTIALGLESGTSSYGPVNGNVSALVQVFSAESDEPLFEYYHDGTTLADSPGVKTVDGDSIYRTGSIGKLYTVYMLLAEIGDKHWDVAVTDVVPELRNRTDWATNELDFVKWQDITLGALAGQIAGITRDLTAFGDGLETIPGLPPLTPEEQPPCRISEDPKIGNTCDRAAFFAALDSRQPVLPPNSSPTYSNTGFMILGYALESITGKSYSQIFDSWVAALNLTDTTVRRPSSDAQGLIPYSVELSDWDWELGDMAPAGGQYSSANDMSKVGRSILRSTRLDPNTTRAWLKPTTFTSDARGAVGRPWEIYRDDTLPNRGVVDIYAKGGSVGLYSTFFAVVPDYDVGFVRATAGGASGMWIDSLVVEILFPALEEAARAQADAAYAGAYVAAGAGVNASMVLNTELGKPGLGIVEWIANGTDFVATLASLTGDANLGSENLRLYPTGLRRAVGNGTTEEAWRIAIEPNSRPWARGRFAACGTWLSADSSANGNYALDSVIFTLDGSGESVKTQLRAFKADLTRVE